jgi:hypothetical protein
MGNICERFDVFPLTPEPSSIVGVAVQTLSLLPVNGLRHKPMSGANGWYVWCGQYSDADDFFQPLHVEHLKERLPQVCKYLSLPPGFRFLIEGNEFEDVWFDESLLDI